MMPTADRGYSRNVANNYNMQFVAIVSIDATSRMATGITRYGTKIAIDTGHSSGSVLVTPSMGEQWSVIFNNGIWMLQNKLKGFDPNHMIEATQGQHIVGSGNGPVELNGTAINAYGPIVNQAVATRPANPAVGAQIFDTGTGKPLWWNGTDWVDGSGVVS